MNKPEEREKGREREMEGAGEGREGGRCLRGREVAGHKTGEAQPSKLLDTRQICICTDFVFLLLKFILVLFQYYLTMMLFLSFRMIIYILCHFMLEVHNLPFDITIKKFP